MNDEKCITTKKPCKFEILFLWLCLAVGGYFIGQTMYNGESGSLKYYWCQMSYSSPR